MKSQRLDAVLTSALWVSSGVLWGGWVGMLNVFVRGYDVVVDGSGRRMVLQVFAWYL